MKPFTKNVISHIQEIPIGKVATYGQIARLAGNSRAARQVARILHTMSAKYQLPWHRVVNAKGEIVIQTPDRQILLLESEGIIINDKLRIDLASYQWNGGNTHMDWMEG